MSTTEPHEIHTDEEVREAIEGLTDHDWMRLRRVASRFSYGMDAEDLLHEAIKRCLEPGSRTWPKGITIARCLAEAMRSIANTEYEKLKVKGKIEVSLQSEKGEKIVLPSDALNPEDIASQVEHAIQILVEVDALFADDEVAIRILEARDAEFSPQETLVFAGIDQTTYDSKLRLIRRRLDKKYPKGWTHA